MNYKKVIAVAVILCLSLSVSELELLHALADDATVSSETETAVTETEDNGYFDVVYEATETYKNSKYYEKLKKIPKSGNQAIDTVAIALSQVGYHEGDSNADFDGMNTDGEGDFVEYNTLFGKVDNNAGYGYAWCASFASWCMRQAGVTPEQAYQTEAHAYISCRKWMAGLKDSGKYHGVEENYSPRLGDLIFFKDVDDPTVETTTTHVGIVLLADENYVYTVEGNTNLKMGKEQISNSVTIKTHELDSKYIVGYGCPDYENNADGDLKGWRLDSDKKASPEPINELFDEIRAGNTAIPIFEEKREPDAYIIVAIVLVAVAILAPITVITIKKFKKKPDGGDLQERK